jgi:hypothetical protein
MGPDFEESRPYCGCRIGVERLCSGVSQAGPDVGEGNDLCLCGGETVEGTSGMKRPMHLNLFVQSRGHHEAAWRHPKSSNLPLTDIQYSVEMAQRAEAGLFDSVFFADVLGLWNDVQTTPFNWLEPLTTLAALAMATKRIGLIATASTTYTEAYNLARQFSSLDHISRGRIGWNIVTTWSPQAGGNFGNIGEVSHAERYARAEEYMTVVKALWDSWSDDAVLDDRVAGRYADPLRVRQINHAGKYYKVKGPLNLPRSPQVGRCSCKRDHRIPVKSSLPVTPRRYSRLISRRRPRKPSTKI